MNFEFAYRPSRLQELIEIIRKNYPSHEEFIRSDHSENIIRMLESISFVDDSMLLKYAGTLKNSEIEYVLLTLASCSDERLCDKLSAILEFRFRKKLFELNWVMLQADFANRNLLNSMSRLTKCLKEKLPEDYAVSIFAKLDGLEKSLPECIHVLLVSEGIDIHTFCRNYTLAVDSSMAKKVSELFFLKCSKEGFTRNRTVFTGLLGDMDVVRAASVITCYLDKLEVQEYFDELNYFIKERFGEPGNPREPGVSGSFAVVGLWGLLPKACVDKYLCWQDLKRIEAHFGQDGKRFRLWAAYFDKMKQIAWNEGEGLLFMDFGTFVAVDSREDENTSYIYGRKYFESEREQYELVNAGDSGQCHWRIIPEHVMEARDLIIEDMNSDVYRVGYDRVKLLYLKEILRVKLEGNMASGVPCLCR